MMVRSHSSDTSKNQCAITSQKKADLSLNPKSAIYDTTPFGVNYSLEINFRSLYE